MVAMVTVNRQIMKICVSNSDFLARICNEKKLFAKTAIYQYVQKIFSHLINFTLLSDQNTGGYLIQY